MPITEQRRAELEADYATGVYNIARVCHEANRAWCVANGDDSQKPWDEAEEWQRESAISGVRFVLDHPDAGDSASHDNWTRDKVADGWTYGPVKDAAAKTHPCLVSFDALPKVQKAKDRLFRAIVLALAWPAPSRWRGDEGRHGTGSRGRSTSPSTRSTSNARSRPRASSTARLPLGLA